MNIQRLQKGHTQGDFPGQQRTRVSLGFKLGCISETKDSKKSPTIWNKKSRNYMYSIYTLYLLV